MKRLLLLNVAFFLAGSALSQGQQPASAPAKPDYVLRVLELAGRMRVAPTGTNPMTEAGWVQAKVGDAIKSEMAMFTSAHSSAKLVLEPADPPAIVLLESNTLASIDELFKAAEPGSGKPVMVSRLGIAYGAVRAGVAEGSVRGDLEIRSPVATLAKRGTWDFRFFAESGTGNFQISLAERGLVQAIQNATGQRVNINPGQFANQAMTRWIDSIKFNRPVNVQDWYGLKGTELVFNLANQTGLGVLNPGGDPVKILDLTGKQSSALFQQFLNGQRNQLLGDGSVRPGDLINAFQRNQNQLDLNLFGPRRRPEGNFGVGQGVVPVIIGANSTIAKQGIAQPGRMDFHRADLVKFMGGK